MSLWDQAMGKIFGVPDVPKEKPKVIQKPKYQPRPSAIDSVNRVLEAEDLQKELGGETKQPVDLTAVYQAMGVPQDRIPTPNMIPKATEEPASSLEVPQEPTTFEEIIKNHQTEEEKRMAPYVERAKQTIDEQKAGVAKSEAYQKQLEEMKPWENLAPLHGLVKQWTGIDPGVGYVTPQMRIKELMDTQKLAQEQKKGVSQEELALLKELSGNDIDLKTLISAQLGQQRLGMMDDRGAIALDRYIENYKPMSQLTTQLISVNKGLNVLDQPTITAGTISELQRDLANALSNSSVVTDAAQRGVTIKTLNQDIAAIETYFKNNPQNLAYSNPKVIQSLKRQFQVLASSLAENQYRTYNKLVTGIKGSNSPAQRELIKQKEADYKAQMDRYRYSEPVAPKSKSTGTRNPSGINPAKVWRNYVK